MAKIRGTEAKGRGTAAIVIQKLWAQRSFVFSQIASTQYVIEKKKPETAAPCVYVSYKFCIGDSDGFSLEIDFFSPVSVS